LKNCRFSRIPRHCHVFVDVLRVFSGKFQARGKVSRASMKFHSYSAQALWILHLSSILQFNSSWR
jgi:hypothetical protein